MPAPDAPFACVPTRVPTGAPAVVPPTGPGALPGDPAILVDGLIVVRGGRRAVDDVSFTVAPGELVGLIGPSGCGKSTLMRSLVGAQVVASGRVELFGLAAGSRGLRSRVGYVTQAPAVYRDLSVTENLGYFAIVLGAPDGDVGRVIAEVGLEGHADTVVGRLSGGEQARVSLATALLGSPEVLVLDEPTVGLDPLLRRDLWALFASLAGAGAAILVSSHVMDEAERCPRLLLMRDGRVLADGSPPALLARTGTATVESAFVSLIEDQAT